MARDRQKNKEAVKQIKKQLGRSSPAKNVKVVVQGSPFVKLAEKVLQTQV